VAETIDIGVAVLADDCRDTLRMTHGKPQPGRRAVVEYVKGITLKPKRLGETFDRVRQCVEGISKASARRRLGLPKARKVGRYHPVAISQKMEEIAEHVACCWEAV